MKNYQIWILINIINITNKINWNKLSNLNKVLIKFNNKFNKSHPL